MDSCDVGNYCKLISDYSYNAYLRRTLGDRCAFLRSKRDLN